MQSTNHFVQMAADKTKLSFNFGAKAALKASSLNELLCVLPLALLW
jgi:hypothetical protein